MARIGVAIKPGVPQARGLLEKILSWAGEHGHELSIDQSTSDFYGFGEIPAKDVDSLVGYADWMLSLGGDGTLIWLARHARSNGPIFVGVHFGTFGFLTDIREAELPDVLESLHKGTFEVVDRGILDARLEKEGKETFSSPVVNDAVIQKGCHGRLIEIDLIIDGEDVTRLRADGIIVATPTGSTAYSLAAGGSLVQPSLPVTLITPICAHSLTNRPLVISMDSVIQLRIPKGSGEVFLTIDGQQTSSIEGDDVVTIRRGSHPVRFLKAPSRSYYEVLRSKLKWG